MALVNTDDSLLTQGFFKTKFWRKLLSMLSKKQNDLGINASSGSSTKFLNEQGNFVTPSGAYPDMTAGGQYVPRSNGDLNDQYSKNDFTIAEYQNTASNRPTPNGWYFSMAMCGGDSGYGAQIAPGMTIDRIFWRNKQEGTHGYWREIPSFPGTTGVGYARKPVYIDPEGTVKECLLGIHSYNFASATNYYKLVDITFDNPDLAYAGVQIAVQWRDNGNLTGCGIITISFSEWLSADYGDVLKGSVFVTFCRGDASTFATTGFIFFVRKNTNTSYTLYARIPQFRAISFALLSGKCTGFSVPDAITTISYSSADTKLPYFVPSGTTYTPT